MLTIHITLVIISIVSFISRVLLLEIKPDLLKNKAIKISPHIIDTLLLLSGILLVVQGQWLSSEYGWIISKLFILTVYIGLGFVVMRSQGNKRWLAFAGAIVCYAYILVVAITKQSFF